MQAAFARLRANWQILRRAADTFGAEYEQMSYAALQQSAEMLSGQRVFEGHTLLIAAEAYDKKANDDLCFCVDVSGLPTLLGIKPSYHFFKRPDGSVYY
jgi:hypothetical protein